jgi:hypothetical protein
LPLHVAGAVRFALPLHAAGPQTTPAGAGAQLPAEPATAQDVQIGQLAAPQHTPSTQWPLTHWGSVAHATPFTRRLAHDVPTQEDPMTQSPSTPHVVRHAPFPQTYGLQLTESCAHVPAPLQKPAAVYVVPEHDACPQAVVVGAFWQLPAPLQAPVKPQGGAATQRPCGSAAAAGTSLHVPALPVMLHAWQVPQAGVEQHTPSTQVFPVRHSSVVAQDCPRRFLSPQRLVLRSQMLGAAQLASVTQVVLQAVPLQA